MAFFDKVADPDNALKQASAGIHVWGVLRNVGLIGSMVLLILGADLAQAETAASGNCQTTGHSSTEPASKQTRPNGGAAVSSSSGTSAKIAGGSQPTQDTPPEFPYWHVWTDDDGMTHQTRCELTAFHLHRMGGGVAPQWNDLLVTSETTVLVAIMPVGWIGDWHENPKPQWIVPLSGRWFVETTDGMRVEMGPGELSFGGDQNTKPDAQGRIGHRSGTVGDVPAVVMIVQLDDKKWVAARPGAFK
jgi:hypothetical protein